MPAHGFLQSTGAPWFIGGVAEGGWPCTTCLLQVSVDVPDQKGRLAILDVHARNKRLGEDIDLKEVALRTPGFSGADLANLLNEVQCRCDFVVFPTHFGVPPGGLRVQVGCC